MSTTKTIDARGSYCPGPLMELVKAMKKASVGDAVEVLSNDAGSAVDIPVWVQKMGHELVSIEQVENYWIISVKKQK